MKKFLALMLALCMMCMMIPAFAEETTNVWYLNAIGFGDAQMSPLDWGISMTLVLNDDGTCTMTTVNEDETSEYSGTYTVDGDTYTVQMEPDGNGEEQEAIVFTLIDGQLIADDHGSSLIFADTEPVAIPDPEPVLAETEEEFYGVWTYDSISMMGYKLPASSWGISGLLTIDAGTAVIDALNGEETTTVEYAVEFLDGILLLTLTDDEGNVTYSSLTLLDDGSMVMLEVNPDTEEQAETEEEGGLDLEMATYFVPYVEEAEEAA